MMPHANWDPMEYMVATAMLISLVMASIVSVSSTFTTVRSMRFHRNEPFMRKFSF